MSNWSGREDLNLRPRRPERRALAKLSHAPNHFYNSLPQRCKGCKEKPELIRQNKIAFFILLQMLLFLPQYSPRYQMR